MKIVSTFFLAAVLAGPAQAQLCSGGNGGGIDATGNQCNAPNDAAAYAPGAGIVPSAQTTKMFAGQGAVPAALPSVRSAKMSGPPSTPTVVATPASRTASSAALPGIPARTAKIGIASESACSGGADGGMDVTGNQCGGASGVARIVLVAEPGRRYADDRM